MTKWKALPIAVGIVTIGYCSYLFAQTQPPPPRGGQDPRMEQMIDVMFQDMDANHDGKISKKEWMAAQERHFSQLDKNGDGFITKDEVRADMMERMRASQPPPPQQGGRAPQ
jgi:hypothetical protein